MRTFDEWMSDYGESHQNPANKILHKIFVPLIMYSLLGFLWLIPKPEVFTNVPYLNWASIFGAGCILFYLSLNIKYAIILLLEVALMLFAVDWVIQNVEMNMWIFFGATFFLSWVGQFIGHHFEGKKPSFFDDLKFLLIGPLWVVKAILD